MLQPASADTEVTEDTEAEETTEGGPEGLPLITTAAPESDSEISVDQRGLAFPLLLECSIPRPEGFTAENAESPKIGAGSDEPLILTNWTLTRLPQLTGGRNASR